MFLQGRPDLLVNIKRKNQQQHSPQMNTLPSSRSSSDAHRPSLDAQSLTSRLLELEQKQYRTHQLLLEAKETITTQREIIRLLYEASRDNNPNLPGHLFPTVKIDAW